MGKSLNAELKKVLTFVAGKMVKKLKKKKAKKAKKPNPKKSLAQYAKDKLLYDLQAKLGMGGIGGGSLGLPLRPVVNLDTELVKKDIQELKESQKQNKTNISRIASGTDNYRKQLALEHKQQANPREAMDIGEPMPIEDLPAMKEAVNRAELADNKVKEVENDRDLLKAEIQTLIERLNNAIEIGDAQATKDLHREMELSREREKELKREYNEVKQALNEQMKKLNHDFLNVNFNPTITKQKKYKRPTPIVEDEEGENIRNQLLQPQTNVSSSSSSTSSSTKKTKPKRPTPIDEGDNIRNQLFQPQTNVSSSSSSTSSSTPTIAKETKLIQPKPIEEDENIRNQLLQPQTNVSSSSSSSTPSVTVNTRTKAGVVLKPPPRFK